MNIFVDPNVAPFIQILLATALGMILGIERVLAGRTAGPRTYGLVSLGACLLTLISLTAAQHYPQVSKADPVSIVSAIVSGIGFIGAGLIIFRKSKVSGLTTAAGIWVAAAIGIVVGFGNYMLALFATFVTLAVFTIMWNLERSLVKFIKKHEHHHPPHHTEE